MGKMASREPGQSKCRWLVGFRQERKDEQGGGVGILLRLRMYCRLSPERTVWLLGAKASLLIRLVLENLELERLNFKLGLSHAQ